MPSKYARSRRSQVYIALYHAEQALLTLGHASVHDRRRKQLRTDIAALRMALDAHNDRLLARFNTEATAHALSRVSRHARHDRRHQRAD